MRIINMETEPRRGPTEARAPDLYTEHQSLVKWTHCGRGQTLLHRGVAGKAQLQLQ